MAKRKALVGLAFILVQPIAVALPGWASGNMESDGVSSWLPVILTLGLLSLVGFNKELAQKHTPNVTTLTRWLGRGAVVSLPLTLGLSFWSAGALDVTWGLAAAWSLAKIAHALYIAGLTTGLNTRAELHPEFPQHTVPQLQSPHSPKTIEPSSLPPGTSTALVAWAPPGIAAPIELTAVWIRAGMVTEQAWWQALSDRVTKLATQATPDEISWANRALGSDVANIEEPQEAGQVLVEGNLNLRTWISLSVLDESPFPAQVLESDPDAEEALSSIDLQDWAELARAQTSSSGD